MEADEDADAFADALSVLHRLIRRRVRAAMPALPLRGAPELLRLVVARPGIRVSDAAKELYLAGNSVSPLVNHLREAGYLVRETDPDDRRSALLRPTPAGAARLRDWQTHRSALVREQMARLTEEDRAAIAAAVPVLRRLARHLHEDRTQGAADPDGREEPEGPAAPKGPVGPTPPTGATHAQTPPGPEGAEEPGGTQEAQAAGGLDP
jgi:DNA-binding MarR family transcriptional regulator